MKIVIACFGTSHYHGAAKYFYFLAKHLARQGIEVEIIVDSDKGRERLEKVCNNVKSTIIHPSTGDKINILGRSLYSMNLARYLKNESFDILHTYAVIPYVYLHMKNRAPTVWQALGNEAFNLPSVLKIRDVTKIFLHFLAQPVWRYCGTQANIIAAEGNFQIEEIMKIYRVSQDKIFVLPIGVDSSLIKERLKTRTISREELGLSSSDFVMLSVNTLHTVKGINYLVDAFYMVKQKLTNAKLIIIGSGPEENRIYSQIRACQLMDSIIPLKNVPEAALYDYYALSDLFVSPTLQKDFIMGILEAEVCGLPVVSTGQAWLIKEGENGYVIPPRDPPAMVEAILKVYNGNRKVMGTVSREIAKDYDFEAIAQIAIKQYQKLLG